MPALTAADLDRARIARELNDLHGARAATDLTIQGVLERLDAVEGAKPARKTKTTAPAGDAEGSADD